MRRIGLLGGMSFESSAIYYRPINEAVRERLGGWRSADILMRSVDFQEVVDMQRSGRWDDAGRYLAEAARELEAAGAECIVVCTNTMHLVAPAIAAAVGVPLLHVIDITAERLKAAGRRRPLLLATRYTMEQGFYQTRMERHGIDVMIPGPEGRKRAHDIIFDELCAGKILDLSRDALIDLVAHAKADGADSLIFGCTEIAMILDPDSTPLPGFDSTAIHAAAAVDFALNEHDSDQKPTPAIAKAASCVAPPETAQSPIHADPRTVPNPANEPSARFFAGIGIAPGMRVLDVGCGNGDLSRLVAGLVGPDGEVVAIDRSAEAVALGRAADSGPRAATIRYRQADLAGELTDLGRFDAIVGRRVLMYLPDAAATLARLALLAKPGAIMAFQEHGRTELPAGLGDLPLHRRLYGWFWNTVAAEGGDTALALRLVDLMRAAGHGIEVARTEGVLLPAGQPSFLPALARAMLPRLVAHGVADAQEMDLDTLADRLAAEHRAAGGTIVWDLAFLVSARVTPGK